MQKNKRKRYSLIFTFVYSLLVILSSAEQRQNGSNDKSVGKRIEWFVKATSLEMSPASSLLVASRRAGKEVIHKKIKIDKTLFSSRVYSSKWFVQKPMSNKNGIYFTAVSQTLPSHGNRKLLSIEKKLAAKKWLTDQVNLYQNHIKLSSVALTKAKIKVADIPFNPMDPAFKKDIEVKISSDEDPFPCRIYIDAEPGAKVVAPCKCRGTQKWIQLAALNRQRRLEPEKWIKCSVCNSEIDYSKYHRHVPNLLKLISWPLDHRDRTKLILGTFMTLGGLFLSLPAYILSVNLMASGFFWRQYRLWSWVVYGALPLKLVVIRFVFGYLFSIYSTTEKSIREHLTELETSILELSIPVTN